MKRKKKPKPSITRVVSYEPASATATTTTTKLTCQFCGKKCDKDDVCAGCKGVICHECDTGEAPWGFDHQPEDHLAEEPRNRR